MAFLCPQLFDLILSPSAGEALVLIGWIRTVRCWACRGILVHPDFLTIAGGSSYRARVAEQQYKAVSPTVKPSVTQNSVPKNLPAPTCRAQRGMNSFGCKEAIIPFSPKGSLLSGSEKVSVLLVWVWEEGRTLSAPSTELSVPRISPDCNRRVHSHFSPKSQLVFPLPAVICHWFLGHEHWPSAQTRRKLETASRHLCHSDRFLHPCSMKNRWQGDRLLLDAPSMFSHPVGQ